MTSSHVDNDITCHKSTICQSLGQINKTYTRHLLYHRVAPLCWRVYPRDQSQISAGVRKSVIYVTAVS